MKPWIKETPVDDLNLDKDYFIARNWGVDGALFWSRYSNGKQAWSVKPGLAIRYAGDEALKTVITKNPGCVAIEVPADAHKRWKRHLKRPLLSRLKAPEKEDK